MPEINEGFSAEKVPHAEPALSSREASPVVSELESAHRVKEPPVASASGTLPGQRATLKANAIGLPGVLFQSITAMAPASAVATALTPAVPLAGASLPLAVVAATIACIFIAACIGQLAVHIPSAGGLTTYISRSLGPHVGFLSAWIFLLAQPLLLPLLSLVWGPYLEDLVKLLTGIDISWIVWVIVGNAALLLLTYSGIQRSTVVSVILGSIEIGIILALSLTMILRAPNDVATLTPAYSLQQSFGGWGGIFQGMLFAFLAFTGFEAAAPLGEETTHPRRTIPLAVIFSALGIGVFYTIGSYAGMIGWGVSHIAGYAASPAPWIELGQRFWGWLGPVLISFVTINSALGNGNAGINATSRVAYAMGRSGTLPHLFARLSR
ncbi:APC family permease [Ktedonosporobacter rubrisoli]|uniref:APC family permease n=1 Tax=Ktedonosporobacter rubrisoli TaxID=2509675 RepID=A0A4P6JPV1_KTERU|nr:APC family permease [Ktedonosporobacter rubrisoli]QBD77122.1 APC family permease [Ktedonosporobacter rubrisoli]